MKRRTRPYIFTGWFGFLGMLVPVIGWLHIGEAAFSDRYTYLPHFFLGIAVVLWVAEFCERRPGILRKILPFFSAVLLIVLSLLGFKQVSKWENILTLNQYAIVVNPDNHMANYNLGLEYARQNRYLEALPYLEEADRLKPDSVKINFVRGVTLARLDRDGEAMEYLRRVMRMKPNHKDAHKMIAEVYKKKKNTADEAKKHYEIALQMDPEDAVTHYNLANLYKKSKQYEKAADHYKKTIAIDPGHVKAINNLGNIYAINEKYDEAVNFYNEVLRYDPHHEQAAYNLAMVYLKQRKGEPARRIYETFLTRHPDSSAYRKKIEKLLRDPSEMEI